MTIRAATEADAPAIAEIWNEIIRTSATTFTTVEKSEAEIAELVRARLCVVAEAGGRIAGFATCGPFRSGPGYRHTAEHSLYVRAEARGAGHGRALMMALEERAKSQGIEVLVAGIGGENTGAQGFHARLGFRKEGQLSGVGQKFGRRHDLILMTKKL